jgi:hypothetical protein
MRHRTAPCASRKVEISSVSATPPGRVAKFASVLWTLTWDQEPTGKGTASAVPNQATIPPRPRRDDAPTIAQGHLYVLCKGGDDEVGSELSLKTARRKSVVWRGQSPDAGTLGHTFGHLAGSRRGTATRSAMDPEPNLKPPGSFRSVQACVPMSCRFSLPLC